MVNYDINVGFARVQINPPLGVNIDGYYHKRLAEGILDDLELNAIAFEKDGKKAVIISIDSEACSNEFFDEARERISNATGLEKSAIYINCTHSHTAPCFGHTRFDRNDIDREYYTVVLRKFADVCVYAIKDLKPARMGIAVSKAERVGFNRRYLMKDGSTATNPGVNNPNIVRSIGLLDERVNVVRFERECGDNVVIANFGNHPDVVGGNLISCDWPGFTRRIFERATDNTKCVFLNGAQGDINHVNVKPVGGDLNGMFNDFDDVTRGYAHSRHMGNVVAGALMSVYEKVEYIPVDEVKFIEKYVQIASNMPKPEEMEEARYILKMDAEGRNSELPYKGMMLTTMLADAGRKVRLEHGPEFFPLNLLGIKIGQVAFMAIPGEPFTGVGLGLKETQGYDLVLPCCNTNAKEGYFPMREAYLEGGYEARSSNFKEGVAERIITEGQRILGNIR